MAIAPKLATDIAQSLLKFQLLFFFAENDKPILKLIKKFKGLRRAEIILKNKNKTGRITLPNCKTYYKSTTIEIM